MLLRRIKLAEVVLVGLAGIGFLLKSGLFLAVVFIALSANLAFFSPVRTAAMPKYLRADELVHGNAYCNAGMFIAVVMGLVVGGVLIPLDNGRVLVSAGLFAAALIGWLSVLAAPNAPPDSPDLKIDWNPIGQTIRIMGYAFSEPGVWRPLMGVSMFYVVSTITTILVPLYAIEELGANGAAATSIMALFAVGAGIGAIGAAGLSKAKSGLGFSCLGIGGASAMTFTLFWLTGIVAATGKSDSVFALLSHTPGRLLLAGIALSAAFTGLYLAPLQAAAQRRAPVATRARTLAAGNLLNAVCAMAGSLCVLIITATPMTPKTGLLVISIVEAAIAAYMIVRWLSLPSGYYDEALSRPIGEQMPAA